MARTEFELIEKRLDSIAIEHPTARKQVVEVLVVGQSGLILPESSAFLIQLLVVDVIDEDPEFIDDFQKNGDDFGVGFERGCCGSVSTFILLFEVGHVLWEVPFELRRKQLYVDLAQ